MIVKTNGLGLSGPLRTSRIINFLHLLLLNFCKILQLTGLMTNKNKAFPFELNIDAYHVKG